MRVLHLNAGNLYGGIETLLMTLARKEALCGSLEQEFALCFEGRLSEELRSVGAPVHHLGETRVSRPWTVLRGRARLRQLLHQGRHDLVVTHGCWPHALFGPVARRTAVPVVFWAHGIAGGRHWIERWAGWCRPDLVLANSQITRASLAAAGMFRNARAEVLYLPVDPLNVPDRSDDVRREVRQELGCPSDEAPVIITVCRFEECKGHAVLIDALATLQGLLPDWQWWIVGGAQRPQEQAFVEALKQRADARGLSSSRARFLGTRGDVPRLLAAADIHCQPNTGPESFGIAFIEALSAGLPVVSTALGGAVEIVDETCGILVPPGDVAALAAALSRLMTSPAERKRLGSAGPNRARELCDPARQLGRLSTILTDLAGGWRRRRRQQQRAG
jgi:glycosyltransferase involved in cell wall biosynthesis